MTETDEKNNQRYHAAMHAVQSAVALDIQVSGDNGAGADHKHLRTGINACLVDSLAVSRLLMQKGIFSESEYLEAIALAAEAEVGRMTARLRERTGVANLEFG